MSTVVTTDVFCDGEECSQWFSGVTAIRKSARDARDNARRAGWSISWRGDFCPACARLMVLSLRKD